MSKKTRGAARTRHRRPGTRPAGSRPASARPISHPVDGPAPEPTSGELVSDSQPLDSAASASTQQPATASRRQPVTSGHARPRAKPGSLLAARASTEYVYVAQDLKRIALVGGVLFGALILLWLVIVVFRLSPLPFY